MKARLGAWIERLGDQFWLRPAVVVVLCMRRRPGGGLDRDGPSVLVAGLRRRARGATAAARRGHVPCSGAVGSSSIGVAGTIFSITIAALSLASGQMGPRLLRNFVRDARNQLVLGIFLGTFAYTLIVLRTVRTQDEGAFVPHAAITGAIVLAVLCIGTLVWFVHHIATSINVEKVVEAVHRRPGLGHRGRGPRRRRA